MQALHLLEPGQVEVIDLPMPTPDAGEVVVRVECALTCGTDVKAYRRGHPFIPMPGPFGHQYSGTISAVGAGVDAFESGQAIWGVHSAPCFDCPACGRGCHSLCTRLREHMVIGAFAQYLRIPRQVVEQSLLARPTSLSSLTAAFLEPVSCIVHAMSMVDWTRTERVLVLGLGSMGLLFTQLLRTMTQCAVVAVGRQEVRLNLARSYGLEGVVAAGPDGEFDRSVANEYDCVVECTGVESGWRSALDAVCPGGHVLFFGGLPKGTMFSVDSYQLHYGETHLHGAFHFGPNDVRKAAEIIAAGALRLDEMISDTLPLSCVQHGLKEMGAGRAIKFAVDPWSE